jgi:hypothetical protein
VRATRWCSDANVCARSASKRKTKDTEARDTGRKIKNTMIESIKQEIPRENPMIK